LLAALGWFCNHQPKETIMLKIAALTGALAVGLVNGAYAQTGPSAQTDMNKPSMTNSNSDAKKDSTTGMSNPANKETGWSGIGEKGTAYDGPAPKTTTGPASSGSKSESPAK
jgi:hypothetical protein